MIEFGAGTLFAVAKTDAAGAAIANATPVQFGTLQEVVPDFSFEEKLLYGAYQQPVAFARGKMNTKVKTKAASIKGQIFSDLVFGVPATAGIKAVLPNFDAVAAATLTVVPPSSGTFLSDKGVVNKVTGKSMRKVALTPAAGEYSVTAGGAYSFNAADVSANLPVQVSYEYSASSSSSKIIQLNNQLMGYAPSFGVALQLGFNGDNFTLVLNDCRSSKFGMQFKNDDFNIPDFEFSAIADATGSLGYISLSE